VKKFGPQVVRFKRLRVTSLECVGRKKRKEKNSSMCTDKSIVHGKKKKKRKEKEFVMIS